MSLATRPQTYRLSFGDEGLISLLPSPIPDGRVKDIVLLSIGFSTEPCDMPLPCFDIDELRLKNEKVILRRKQEDSVLCN
jgi:hypothetical protein